MYRYDEFDARLVRERVAQFRGQVARRLSGELSEEEFKPLRLMNGVYLQLHAYMLRVAVPYGTLSSRQLRKLAHIAAVYDKNYGHFTTRQNIQFNWPQLRDIPDILGELSEVEMHAIQTSGNCIRNVTADPFAGAAADEIEDPRPICELIRQWSTFHPEFTFLPRKFKIAVTGAPHDRAAIKVHDIGLRMHRNAAGAPGFEVVVGGGQGRTPMIGKTIRRWLARDEILAYLEAIMRVYNLHGRRDNKYKARVKILVHEIGAAQFAAQVEREYENSAGQARKALPDAAEIQRIARYFAPPIGGAEADGEGAKKLRAARGTDGDFDLWCRASLAAHKIPGHAIVTVSLKPAGGIPGDATAEQMRSVAGLAERFSHGEVRVSHEQNLVLPWVRAAEVHELWRGLRDSGLAAANAGLAGDIICCPGLDYCTLATARSIPVARQLSLQLGGAKRQRDIGGLSINISGCINACGHHHVGNIGILGLEKKGREFYQITLGGSADESAAIGDIVGPGFAAEEVGDAVDLVVGTYLKIRRAGETFIDTYRRVGTQPFKEALYAA
ncbi:MAG: nitrite/sulfite reductase [Gammaproteobacteria bacterium]|nr:nitrite/sulfite reductase [Gammaproteobacteria bacterium]